MEKQCYRISLKSIFSNHLGERQWNHILKINILMLWRSKACTLQDYRLLLRFPLTSCSLNFVQPARWKLLPRRVEIRSRIWWFPFTHFLHWMTYIMRLCYCKTSFTFLVYHYFHAGHVSLCRAVTFKVILSGTFMWFLMNSVHCCMPQCLFWF